MMAAGIEYMQSGSGDPIIFLHGIGGNISSFEHQIHQFPGFSKIAWNMPGYGKSQSANDPLSFEHLSEKLSNLISELKLQKAHLVGHSIGGMLALEHTVRKPEEVSSITMMGATPNFGGRDDSFKKAFLEARSAPLEAGKTIPEIAASSAPHLVGKKADDTIVKAIEHQLAQVSEKTWRSILKCLITFNRRDALQHLNVPCCLIAGNEDTNAPAATMEKAASRIPNAEFHLLNNVGHMINQEAPEETNSIITKFLGKFQS